jgi:primosomal protein N'
LPAGRKEKRGKVIIQTADPEHWVIQLVMKHDYFGFYKNEIIERENFFYPPFYKMITLTLKHKEEFLVDRAALELAQFVDKAPNLKFHGVFAYDGVVQHVEGFKARKAQAFKTFEPVPLNTMCLGISICFCFINSAM